MFTVWYEGKKDGFDTDRVFDLIFISIVVAILSVIFTNYWFQRLQIVAYTSVLLKLDATAFAVTLASLVSLGIFTYFIRKWKWSIYRVMDDFSMGINFLLIFAATGRLLVFGELKQIAVITCLLLLYTRFLRFRGYRFPSGYVFTSFLYTTALCLLVFFRVSGYLLFFLVLVTIGTANLYFRRKRSMIKSSLPLDFLNLIKGKLTTKDKELKNQQELLKEEDAYLQEGRAEGNSEIIDEAILEDSQKEITDVKMNAVRSMRLQVRKALAFLKLGRYGICEVCGQPIDKARLEFYPEATKCVECAGKQ